MSRITRRPPTIGAVLVAAAVVVATAAAPTQAAGPAGNVTAAAAPDAIKDSYIVVLRDDRLRPAEVASRATELTGRYGGTVRRTYTAALRGFAAAMNADQARRLAADPTVRLVEQDQVMRVSDRQTPPSWGLDRVDQRDNRLLVDNAFHWHDSVSGNGVRAYVIDTGIRITHREFDTGRASYGWDAVDSDAVADDCNGHGTHVAGTIAGTTYGVAKKAMVVAVRAFDCGGTSPVATVIAAVDWVTLNAIAPAVANFSAGGPPSVALDTAVANGIAAGITFVVAAGNEDDDACNYSPARVPRAITVAATQAFADARAFFSNFGPCVGIFAPGATIRSAWAADDTSTAILDGTSMAAPHVTGTIAQYLQPGWNWTPQQLKDWLYTNATYSVVVGPGTGSTNRFLHSAWWGPVAELVCLSSGLTLNCRVTNRDINAPAWAGSRWWRDGVDDPAWANQESPPGVACVQGNWYVVEVEITTIHGHTDRLTTGSRCNP